MSLYVIWCIRAQFSQIAPITEYQWNRYSLTHRGLWHYSKVSFDVKKGAEDFGLLFMSPCTWFGVFGPNFPKLPQYLSTCETGIARPTEGPDTTVRSHLCETRSWRLLITFHVPLHMIWCFWAQFPQIAPIPENLWIGIIWPTEGLNTSIRSHLMWNKVLKTLEFFLCDSVFDLGVFGPFSPKLS